MAVAVQPSPASILSGPGYRVYEAGHSVQRWGTWIRYTSYVVICLACLGIATNLFKMVKGPEPMVVNDRPHETLRFPWVLYVFEELFNTCNSCLVLLQCKLALDAVKAKSRRGSWVLIKRVALLMLGHVFFYLLIFAVRFIGMWILLADFEELEMDEGRYDFNDGRNSYTYKKGHDGKHGNEDEDEALFGAIIYSFIITSLCCQVLFLAICCSPCFLCYYKFHRGIRSYEELVAGMGLQTNGPPSLNQPNVVLQQQITPTPTIARGQVLGYAQNSA